MTLKRGEGPFQAYHGMMTNPKIQELNVRMHKEELIFKKLKHLRVQSIKSEPDWSDCVHVQFEPDSYDRNLILNMIASKLVHSNKEPTEIAKSDNCIWVRTN